MFFSRMCLSDCCLKRETFLFSLLQKFSKKEILLYCRGLKVFRYFQLFVCKGKQKFANLKQLAVYNSWAFHVI